MGNKQNSSVPAKKSARENEAIDGTSIAYELSKIMRGYFPNLQAMLNQVSDIRRRKDYYTGELLLAAIGMLIFKAPSR